MIELERIKDLAGRRSATASFLSVTLSTSRLDDWRQTAPTFLNSESGRILKERDLDKKQAQTLQNGLQRVLEVAQYDLTHQTQGLAIFADGSDGLFERVELPFRLTNRVVLEPSPYIRPIVHALSLLEPFVLVRVSRDDSSIYLVDEWRLMREDDFSGPYLKSSDRETGDVPIKEYYAAARQETLIEQHYKEVSAALDKVLDKTGVGRVVLCGQHDIAANFRRSLSQRAAGRVVAEIPWDATDSRSQMLVSAREAVEVARHGEMVQLAERIREGLGATGLGVAGFDSTLASLRRGQLRTLLVGRGYRPPGWRCLACDHTVLTPAEECPVCAGGVLPIEDAAGEAVRTAVINGTFVQVAEDTPLLEDFGGIAGLLRYT